MGERIEPTVVLADARWELLRATAYYRANCEIQREAGESSEYDPIAFPLFGCGIQWKSPDEALDLAVRECVRLGEITATPSFFGPYVAITDLGYDRVRAHDLTTAEAPHA